MKFLLCFILFYVVSIVALFIMQRTLIYFPDKSKPQLAPGAEVVSVLTQDNLLLESWYFPAKSPSKAVIVFFHGNAGHYGHRFYKVQKYVSEGYGVLLAEYRGYGGNSGAMSEEGFYHDGRAYINWLLSSKGINIDKIILYGESIGSGSAVQLATEYDVAALILEAPFSSLLEVASQKYFFMPMRNFLKDRYMNIDKIRNVNTPLLILHGKKDNVIPFSSGKKLFNAAKEPKKFINFAQGNHNDLYNFDASRHVLDFLAGIKHINSDNSREIISIVE